MGGKPNNAPPPHAEYKTPPPHGKNGMAPTWREKAAHIVKYPHRGNSPLSHMNILIHAPPPGERLHPPLRAPIMISIKQLLCVALTLFRLFERIRKKNQQKLNKNKNFLALSFNFSGGGGVSIASNIQNFIYR